MFIVHQLKPHSFSLLPSSPSYNSFHSGYNILNHRGKFYGVPSGDKFDWERADSIVENQGLNIATFVVRGETAYDVEQKVNFFRGEKFYFPTPSILKSILWLNLVGYQNGAYLVRKGVDVHFQKDPLPVDVVYIAHVSELREKLRNLITSKTFFSLPLKFQTHSNINIVGFRGLFYGVPQGLDVEWNNSLSTYEEKLLKEETYYQLAQSLGIELEFD